MMVSLLRLQALPWTLMATTLWQHLSAATAAFVLPGFTPTVFHRSPSATSLAIMPTGPWRPATSQPRRRSLMMMAQPRKKLPDRTVHVYCSNCRTCLYRYAKGGTGSLVKCYHERILEDYTKGDLKCPQCQTEFARPALIHGRPANKIIGGKVFQK